MNGIIGHARSAPVDTPDQRSARYAAGAQSCGEALLAIINDILDFSKIESGGLAIHPSPWSALEVVEAAVELLRPARGGACGGPRPGDRWRGCRPSLLVERDAPAAGAAEPPWPTRSSSPPTAGSTSHALYDCWPRRRCASSCRATPDGFEPGDLLSACSEPFVQGDASNHASLRRLRPRAALSVDRLVRADGRAPWTVDPASPAWAARSRSSCGRRLMRARGAVPSRSPCDGRRRRHDSSREWGRTHLVAEDDAVNRMLIEIMLRDRG